MMRSFLVLLIVFGSTMLHAQSTLTGFVIEESDDGKFSPIVFANVFWLGTTTGTASDTNGFFELPLSSESETLVVSYVGYRADTIKVEQKDKLTVILRQQNQLGEVAIEYRQKATTVSFMNPIKVENITQKELYKAACCNLSESFETNPSVDVSFTDAVTGTKQIQMLGLDGKYTQLTRENMPDARGLATTHGLTFTPGSWVKSIQLNKGAGSVVNGYESTTGQINVELKKPEELEKWFLNLYGAQSGRMEANFNSAHKINEKVSTGILLHGNLRPIQVDGNGDGFLDFPTGHQVNAINRWKFNNNKGWEGQLGLKLITEERSGGQSEEITPESGSPLYRINWEVDRIEPWLKTGFVFPERKYASIGFQSSFVHHQETRRFGDWAYSATEQTAYLNLIFQSIIGNSNHKYRTGVSFMGSDVSESLDIDFGRKVTFAGDELVPGAFFEYTYSPSERFGLVAGLRGDYNTMYERLFVVPRLHLRYALDEFTVLRASAGRGVRTAQVISENIHLLATSRDWRIQGDQNIARYGLQPEVAWNGGLNITRDFKLNYRPGSFSADLYHSFFESQSVVDMEDEDSVRVFNLDGESFATSVQFQVDYEVYRNLDLRIAYRHYNVKIDYLEGLRDKPYISRDRAFANLGYAIGKWAVDYTVQYLGPKRLPLINKVPVDHLGRSPSLVLMNTQITRTFGTWLEVYLGVENLTNVTQETPIIDADDPYGPNFDATVVWGPIFGRMTYAGLRFTPGKVKR